MMEFKRLGLLDSYPVIRNGTPWNDCMYFSEILIIIVPAIVPFFVV